MDEEVLYTSFDREASELRTEKQFIDHHVSEEPLLTIQ
jgi:hypothetical protein